MLQNLLRVKIHNECLALSFIWKDRSAKSLGYIMINIVLNTLERYDRSPEILVSVSV